MITKEQFMELIGEFTYCWGNDFFIETSEGNFFWKDPQYPDGDNSIHRFNGNLKQFYEKVGVGFGRDKGKHRIKDYCGTDFSFHPKG